MSTLRDIIGEIFTCLEPLRACEDPIQDRCVYPLQERVIDPVGERCVEPVRRALDVSPLTCVPGLSTRPTLPQNDTESQQENRADQLNRTRTSYQYNYSLVRTFRVEEQNGRPVGVQGEGIAVLDKLPFSQSPSICWLLEVVRHGLIILDNLIVVLELLDQEPATAHDGEAAAPVYQQTNLLAARDARGRGHEADITTVTFDDVSPQELRRKREDVRQLRRNLLGTLVWGQSIADRARAGGDPEEEAALRPLRSPAPAKDSAAGGAFGVSCPCARCSPQAITREIYEDIKHILSDIVERMLQLPELDRQPHSVRAYNDLFQRIPLPQFALTFQSDEMFALQRVAGQNPVVLERVEWTAAWAKKLPVTPEQYSAVMGDDDTLEEAGQDGRLYVCDYATSLTNTIGGDFPPFAGQKYINVPVGLFALDRADRRVIRAVAVQAGQEPGPGNPVVTPADGWNWEIAKTIFQNADCNDSEYYQHLGLGHLLVEAFAIATYRQLPQKHPLYVLLTPHYQGTFATNNAAVLSINDEGSYLNITESIFSCTIPATLGIAANAVHDTNFTDNMVPNQLRRRGVDDPDLLPFYPYRDDALLVRDAIRSWVSSYLRIYYTSDRDVVGDYELQSWVTELSSPQGARLKGVGDGGVGGRILTLDYLTECVTEVIYTASAHHALANFPLIEYEIYSPGWPGALYRAAPTSSEGATRDDWFSYLAPLNIALLQQALGFTVGGVHFTRLGRYPACHFTDSRVRVPLAAFQNALAQVEEIIRERNLTRPLRYPYLLPSRVPQSINI